MTTGTDEYEVTASYLSEEGYIKTHRWLPLKRAYDLRTVGYSWDEANEIAKHLKSKGYEDVSINLYRGALG
jgi:hypothetical protein